MWLRARIEAGGDEAKTELAYARFRVQQLTEEAEALAQAREAESIAALAKVEGKRPQEAESLGPEARKLAAVKRRALVEAWKRERE
jgi:hypothetical protein